MSSSRKEVFEKETELLKYGSIQAAMVVYRKWRMANPEELRMAQGIITHAASSPAKTALRLFGEFSEDLSRILLETNLDDFAPEAKEKLQVLLRQIQDAKELYGEMEEATKP